MLEALFGNKNVQKILIFLFVNEKCYGAQLQRLLKTPLTPIQKALQRLERGGIITSYYEGKTRIYQFDPSFPIFNELEPLLKKVYTLLPPQEKKSYYCNLKPSRKIPASDKQVIPTFWKKLAGIKYLVFHAMTKSKEESGWNGQGKGEVSVVVEGENTLIFNEEGELERKSGQRN